MPVVNHPPVLAEPQIPQHYLHKRVASEVLLTTCETLRPDSFAVTARWPASHPFYASYGDLHDPLLFAESVRQCFPLLSHVGYGVPMGHHLIWQYLSYEIVPAAMRATGEDTELVLHIACSDIRRHRGQLAAVTLHVIAVRDGLHLGSAQARFSCHSPVVYRRLRGSHADSPGADATPRIPPAPVAPGLVRRTGYEDIVLSPTEHHDQWLLRNDLGHPVLFDHPVDHSPGMLLLEAARQAAHAKCGAHGGYPVKFDAVFLQFSEFDTPCRITARPVATGDGQLHQADVQAEQAGDSTFSCAVTLISAP